MAPSKAAPAAEPKYIYRPYITLPDGTKIWAKKYGKKAFRIPVADNDNTD